MKEKTFVKIINGLEAEKNRQTLLNKQLKIIIGDEIQIFYLDKFEDELFKALKDEFNDKDDWLGWWIYEKDFGKNKKLTARYKNKKPIKLDTPEQLYKFLVKNMH